MDLFLTRYPQWGSVNDELEIAGPSSYQNSTLNDQFSDPNQSITVKSESSLFSENVKVMETIIISSDSE